MPCERDGTGRADYTIYCRPTELRSTWRRPAVLRKRTEFSSCNNARIRPGLDLAQFEPSAVHACHAGGNTRGKTNFGSRFHGHGNESSNIVWTDGLWLSLDYYPLYCTEYQVQIATWQSLNLYGLFRPVLVSPVRQNDNLGLIHAPPSSTRVPTLENRRWSQQLP